MEPQRVIDNVCEILERFDRPLKAVDLVRELERRGVLATKSQLNNILYSPEWRRPGLSHDEAFRWSFLKPTAPEETGAPTRNTAAQLKQLRELLAQMEFAGEGVHREGRPEPIFFFLKEEGRGLLSCGK